MIYYDSHSRVVELDSEIDRGGEAAIYTLKDSHELVAKIYHHQPRQPYDHKLAWMQSHPPLDPSLESGHTSIAWPVSLLYTRKHQLSGYLMPYIGGMVKLINVINPGLRRKVLPGFDWRYLHRTARNLATAVNALHQYEYIIGDLNESNVLVAPSALVTLIDTDSFQVYDQDQSLLYYCPVGKPEYTPWELQGLEFRCKKREPQADYFALSVLIFQLLMEGSHPYRGRWTGSDDPATIAEKIQRGLFPYAKNRNLNLPPPHTLGIDMLHPRIKDLLFQCFIEGQNNPNKRPSPISWIQALKTAELALVTCSKGHAYSGYLSCCPWCKKVSKKPSPRSRRVIRGAEQTPQMSIIQSLIHFGLVAPDKRCDARTLLISNRGEGLLKGSITVKDDWLGTSVKDFQLGGGDYTRIDLVADTSTLEGSSRGLLHSTTIWIQSNAGSREILAQVRVGLPVLVARPSQIDFGEVEKGEVGTAVLIISNSGNLPLSGRVKTNAAWISIAKPDFTCLPGVETHVVLLAHTHLVREVNARTALSIGSNGGELSINAQITVGEAVLGIDRRQVDLGTIVKGNHVETGIWITNEGTGVLKGNVMSGVGWLYAEPAVFTCKPGGKALVVVKMDASQPGITLGRDSQRDMVIESNGGNMVVCVNYRVDYPLLKAWILGDTQPIRQGSWSGLVIKNDGNVPLDINISNKLEQYLSGVCLVPELENVSASIQSGCKKLFELPVDYGIGVPHCIEGDLIIRSNISVQTLSLFIDLDQKCWHVIRHKVDLPLASRVFLPFIAIPAGYFLMGVGCVDVGSPDGVFDQPEDEAYKNKLYRGEYWISQRPVSVKMYKAFVDSTGYTLPSGWKRRGYSEGEEEKAMTDISWHDAWAFCRWVSEVTGYSVRLPTELELEKAVGCTELDQEELLWEWTASLDTPLPYQSGDGRNDLSRKGARVLRCFLKPGSASSVTETNRQACSVTQRGESFGFRPVLILH